MSCALTLAGILFFTISIRPGPTVSLKVAPEQDRIALPYRIAELTVRHADDAPKIIRTVGIRETRGGPTFLVPATIPPGTTQTLRLALPAISSQQTYSVRLLSEARLDAPVIAEFKSSLTWGVKLQTTQAWIDTDAYAPHEGDLPQWPPVVKRNVFLTGVLVWLALGGVLLIPPAGRFAAAIAVVAVACHVATVPLRSVDTVIAREVAFPAHHRRHEDEALLAVTSRRTTTWMHERGELIPLYPTRRNMLTDDMVIGPGASIRVLLRPCKVRLFRRRK